MKIEELRGMTEVDLNEAIMMGSGRAIQQYRALLAAIDVCEAADKLLHSQDDPAYYVLLSDRSDRFDSALRGEEKP